MAVQRRVIWLDDPAWGELQKQASEVGLNPSQYIGLRLLRPENEKTLGDTVKASQERAVAGMTQAQRDALLRKVNKK